MRLGPYQKGPEGGDRLRVVGMLAHRKNATWRHGIGRRNLDLAAIQKTAVPEEPLIRPPSLDGRRRVARRKATAVRAISCHARRRGTPVSFIMRELVADWWYRSGIGIPSDAQSDAPPSPMAQPLPHAARLAPRVTPRTLAEMLGGSPQEAHRRAISYLRTS